MTSLFAFSQPEWPSIFEAAHKAEAAAHPDPRAACFYARRALELAVAWAYKSDASLKLPYSENLSEVEVALPGFGAAGDLRLEARTAGILPARLVLDDRRRATCSMSASVQWQLQACRSGVAAVGR